MKVTTQIIRILLSLLVFPGLAGLACGDPAEDTPWSRWSTLQFKAKAAPFIRGQVEMSLEQRPEGPRLETRTSATLLGKRWVRSRTESYFDLAGRTTKHVSYSSRRGRRYVFGKDAYSVERLHGVEDGDGAADEWTVASREEFPYPRTGAGGADEHPFDYYGMLLHLRHLPLTKPGDEATLYVATSDGAHPYRVVVGEERVAQRTYTDLASAQEKTVTLRELRLRVIPADPNAADEGFLRMEGETEIWVEARFKTLLEVSGRIPKVGRVNLRLTAVG